MLLRFLAKSSYKSTLSEIQAFRRLWHGLGSDRQIVIVPAEVQADEDPATGAGELKASNYIFNLERSLF